MTFTLLPQALETLNLSPFVVGGMGLIMGTLVGPRGLGGAFLDLFEEKRGRGLPRYDAPTPAGGDEEPVGAMPSSGAVALASTEEGA
jgi:hypothetical protein